MFNSNRNGLTVSRAAGGQRTINQFFESRKMLSPQLAAMATGGKDTRVGQRGGKHSKAMTRGFYGMDEDSSDEDEGCDEVGDEGDVLEVDYQEYNKVGDDTMDYGFEAMDISDDAQVGDIDEDMLSGQHFGASSGADDVLDLAKWTHDPVWSAGVVQEWAIDEDEDMGGNEEEYDGDYGDRRDRYQHPLIAHAATLPGVSQYTIVTVLHAVDIVVAKVIYKEVWGEHIETAINGCYASYGREIGFAGAWVDRHLTVVQRLENYMNQWVDELLEGDGEFCALR